MIPRLLFRVVPEKTTPDVENAWEAAWRLHPGWNLVTYRDPIDTEQFPVSAPHWPECQSGAQLAGLVRLEALYHHGGIYLDSDVELLRPLTSLLCADLFAAWEDTHTVPDAVIGARPEHPTVAYMLQLAIERLPDGAWKSGPGVTTDVLGAERDRYLLLPPESFYPYHYSQKRRAGEDFGQLPWCYGVHRWAGSWLA